MKKIHVLPLTPNEDPEQEALEAAAKKYSGIAYDRNDYEERYYNQEGCDKYDGFIEGAKWQQERMYSEEEVKQIIDLTLIEYSDFVLADIPHWFEQFKKK